jgi:hypothetical protein
MASACLITAGVRWWLGKMLWKQEFNWHQVTTASMPAAQQLKQNTYMILAVTDQSVYQAAITHSVAL